jgi:hypothetical protein
LWFQVSRVQTPLLTPEEVGGIVEESSEAALPVKLEGSAAGHKVGHKSTGAVPAALTFALAPEDVTEVTASPAPPRAAAPLVNPREALAAELAAHVARLLAAGDVEAARVAHDAMGRLLGAAPATGSAPGMDLSAERQKHGKP